MGLFETKKKNTESLKTLSEKEIQAKLYGHIRTNFRPAGEETSFKSAAASKSSSPALFKSAESSSVTLSGTATMTTAPVKKEEKMRANVQPSLISKYQEKTTKPAKMNVGPFFLNGLKWVISRLVFALRWTVSSAWNAFRVFDFRRPLTQRFVYGGLAVLVLTGLFFGIHQLNLKREAAMKEAPENARKMAAKKSAAKVLAADQEQQALSLPLQDDKEDAVLEPPSNPAIVSKNAVKTKKKISKKKTDSENAPAATTAVTGREDFQGPFYAIQIATFATREDAGNLIDKFKQAGWDAFEKSLTRSGSRLYYCVFVGRFSNRQEAETKLTDFKRSEVSKPFQDAFVRSL